MFLLIVYLGVDESPPEVMVTKGVFLSWKLSTFIKKLFLLIKFPNISYFVKKGQRHNFLYWWRLSITAFSQPAQAYDDKLLNFTSSSLSRIWPWEFWIAELFQKWLSYAKLEYRYKLECPTTDRRFRWPRGAVDNLWWPLIFDDHPPNVAESVEDGTFWPEPVWRPSSGTGSSLDEKEKKFKRYRYSLASFQHWLDSNH